MTAIANYNGRLATLATTLGVTFFDQWAWTTNPARVDGNGDLHYGNHVIAQSSTATLAQTIPSGHPNAGPCDSSGQCATPAYAHNFIASDKLHPNTIAQGLLANEFLNALNPHLGVPIVLLSDAEVLTAAAPGAALVPLLTPGLLPLLASILAGLGAWGCRVPRSPLTCRAAREQ